MGDARVYNEVALSSKVRRGPGGMILSNKLSTSDRGMQTLVKRLEHS